MSARFASLEDVIQDHAFPAVDVALRRGFHIDRDTGDWYAFVTDAQDHLELFYRRYGCELVRQSDGYFYLLPMGDQLSRRHLTGGEMLVGQTLALHYLDPSTLQSGGIVTREQLLARLASLVGERELAKVLEPRRRRFDDERIVHEIIRTRIAEGIRRLASLGFIELLGEERVRLRAPLLRFTEPVRGLTDAAVAMQRLVARGEIVLTAAADNATSVEGAEVDANAGEDVDDELNGSQDGEELAR